MNVSGSPRYGAKRLHACISLATLGVGRRPCEQVACGPTGPTGAAAGTGAGAAAVGVGAVVLRGGGLRAAAVDVGAVVLRGGGLRGGAVVLRGGGLRGGAGCAPPSGLDGGCIPARCLCSSCISRSNRDFLSCRS